MRKITKTKVASAFAIAFVAGMAVSTLDFFLGLAVFAIVLTMTLVMAAIL